MSRKPESKYVRFAHLAYAVAQASVPRYAHPKSPQRFTQPQLVVCLLLTQYLNLSYRNTEEWLLASAEVREVLELTPEPDHTTIARMFKRLTLRRLEALLTQVLSSVIKRLFGDVIRSRSWRLQRREPMLKALVYNIHR